MRNCVGAPNLTESALFNVVFLADHLISTIYFNIFYILFHRMGVVQCFVIVSMLSAQLVLTSPLVMSFIFSLSTYIIVFFAFQV